MSRVYFSSQVDVGSIISLPYSPYTDFYNMWNFTVPNYGYALGSYGGNQYTYQMYVFVGSGSGYIYLSYPYSTGGTSALWTNYILSGPYGAILLNGVGYYPQYFRYWYVPSYGVWTFSSSFYLYYYDWPVVNGSQIYAVFY